MEKDCGTTQASPRPSPHLLMIGQDTQGIFQCMTNASCRLGHVHGLVLLLRLIASAIHHAQSLGLLPFDFLTLAFGNVLLRTMANLPLLPVTSCSLQGSHWSAQWEFDKVYPSATLPSQGWNSKMGSPSRRALDAWRARNECRPPGGRQRFPPLPLQ